MKYCIFQSNIKKPELNPVDILFAILPPRRTQRKESLWQMDKLF